MNNSIPKHVVLFPDGNGDWAIKNRVSSWEAHKKGYENLINFTKWASKRGIKILTVFGFSTENWGRDAKLVNFLMSLFEKKLLENIDIYLNDPEIQKLGIKVKVFGQIDRLSNSLQKAIKKVEEITKDNKEMYLNLAVSYGGKWDILNAVKNIVKEGTPVEKIDEKLFEKHLSLAEFPAPDFLIRAGGQMRLSNFAMWQVAYSELYFSPKLWPDFSEQDLDQALAEFATRDRRFGK